MMPLNNSRGISLIAAIFIIVLLGFMGMIFVSRINTGSFTSVNDLRSAQALYVAEGGLESAVMSLSDPTLVDRTACGSLTGAADFTNEPLGQGQFTVTSTIAYSAAPAVLNGALSGAATTINVNSTAGYPESGRIMIDHELIDYSGTTGGNAFLNALRGRDGTAAAAHASGTRVGQYQCDVTSDGGVPDLLVPRHAERSVQEAVQLQEGWAVGAAGGAGQRPLFIQFNRPTELQWNLYNSAAINVNAQLNGVSMLSYADGWAVGAASPAGNNNGWMFLRWNGAAWNRTTVTNPAVQSRNLNSVYMISANDGWAVGGQGNVASQQPMILWWNGANWALRNNPLSGINQALNSVSCNATNDCWAVGNRTAAANNGWVFLRWNGASWSRTNRTTPNSAARGLNSVFMTSAADGWAVGGANGSVIVHWTGGVWTNVGSPVTQQLNSVYMLDTNRDGIAEDGWAVGARTGGRPTALRWNVNCNGVGTTGVWNNCSATLPATNQNLNGVCCVDDDDCWAVGNAGARLHWDGTNWSAVTIPAVAQALRSVDLVGSRWKVQSAWQEVVQ